ncbi:FxLYD domain-containing protein [Halobium salinum]|uniref:FxLYD domain-containing protein n=1 Tax=Halobium salinum TaxID=1364940 RepID=A0ABD5PCU8_9EURY|nr:FxLYD domain-containing protein [Halobium salinum]
MHRRTFLALAGTGTVAGCLGGGETTGEPSTTTGAGDGTTTENGDATTTTGDTGTETTTGTGGESGTGNESEAGNDTTGSQSTPMAIGRGASVTEHEFRSEVAGGDASPGVFATVLYEGEGHSGRITLTVAFLDEAGETLDEVEATVADLAPEESWEAYVPFEGDAGAVADYEVSGTIMDETPSFNPSEMSFESFSLKRTDEEVYFVATVKNNGEEAFEFLQANCYFHRTKEVVLGSNTTTKEGLGPGETWTFEVPSEMPAFRREQIGTKTGSLSTVEF